MIKNPIELRLSKLKDWQLRTFMVCLCERMYLNYALFCLQTRFADPNKFRSILNLVWESLLVNNTKINFDSQLEKLESLIPEADKFDFYGVGPAMDACEAVSELLHSYLNSDIVNHAKRISAISLCTVADFEQASQGQYLAEAELKNLPNIVNELDIQWEIYRLLKVENIRNIELIKGLKDDLVESKISNLGFFLNN